MAAKNVGLAQLLTFAGAKQKPRLTVADELNQQLRNVLREVYFTLTVFRLEIVVNFAVPCLLINNDAGAAIENLLDADSAPDDARREKVGQLIFVRSHWNTAHVASRSSLL